WRRRNRRCVGSVGSTRSDRPNAGSGFSPMRCWLIRPVSCRERVDALASKDCTAGVRRPESLQTWGLAAGGGTEPPRAVSLWQGRDGRSGAKMAGGLWPLNYPRRRGGFRVPRGLQSQGAIQIHSRESKFGVEPQGFPEVPDRLVQITFLPQHDTQV